MAEPEVSPLRSIRLYFTSEQLAYLKLTAGKRHLTVSALAREMVERRLQQQRGTKKRQAGKRPAR